MPIQLGKVDAMPLEDFEALRGTHRGWIYNPAMVSLLQQVQELGALRVALLPGQNPRSVRSAISNSARSRGIRVETLAGDDFVAVRYVGPYEETKP